MAKILSAAHVAAIVFGACLIGVSAIGGPSFAASSDRALADQPPAEPATVKSPARFEFYRTEGVPADYRGKTNPYPQPTIASVIKGADRYNARCASCHGLMGFGNGDGSGALRTKPADLAWSLSDRRIKDDYLYWTISQGGAQFGSSMPAYKKPDLSDGQIWEIITYMRAAFEGREASTTPGRGNGRQAMGNARR